MCHQVEMTLCRDPLVMATMVTGSSENCTLFAQAVRWFVYIMNHTHTHRHTSWALWLFCVTPTSALVQWLDLYLFSFFLSVTKMELSLLILSTQVLIQWIHFFKALYEVCSSNEWKSSATVTLWPSMPCHLKHCVELTVFKLHMFYVGVVRKEARKYPTSLSAY